MTDAASLYGAEHEGRLYPILNAERTADVAIIGGGLTGLSAALHLAQLGQSVVVLEAEQPGWGASGRNGGQVNPGLKTTPEEVERDFGPVFGPRLVEAAWNAPDLVFDLIDRYGIACDAERGGTIRAATALSQLPALRTLTDQCAERGGPVTWLTAADIAARTGARCYCGGMIDARGGQLDPLAYTRGLANAATGEGASIYGQSRVVAMRREGPVWCVTTAQGSVRAAQVVFATNGYTDRLWNRLRRSVVPVYSAIVASASLSPELRAKILAKREVLYELGDITTYYRIDGQGRLLMGGRSRSYEANGPEHFAYLSTRAQTLWPELADVAWTHGWNGQLAITLDHYPHWHNPGPGILACLGYNGRGVAMGTATGRAIAQHLTENAPPLFPLSPVKPIAGHAAWKIGVEARIAWGRLKDRLS